MHNVWFVIILYLFPVYKLINLQSYKVFNL